MKGPIPVVGLAEAPVMAQVYTSFGFKNVQAVANVADIQAQRAIAIAAPVAVELLCYVGDTQPKLTRPVEALHLPTRKIPKVLGNPSSTWYDCYARWNNGGINALADRSPEPRPAWNRIPDKVGDESIHFALAHHNPTPRWQQTTKNLVLLENCLLPGDLEQQIGPFAGHYNNSRYHQSVDTPTPADVYQGLGAKNLKMRENIETQTH